MSDTAKSLGTLTHSLPNFALFQGVWWCCILGYESTAWGLLAILFVHYCLTLTKTPANHFNIAKDWMVLPIAFVGLISDWLMYQMGFYQFQGQGFPMWLLLLWLAFPLTLTRSLSSLINRQWLWLSLCIVFGPLAYMGGQLYGRIELGGFSFMAMAIQWLFMGSFIYFLLGNRKSYGSTFLRDDLTKRHFSMQPVSTVVNRPRRINQNPSDRHRA